MKKDWIWLVASEASVCGWLHCFGRWQGRQGMVAASTCRGKLLTSRFPGSNEEEGRAPNSLHAHAAKHLSSFHRAGVTFCISCLVAATEYLAAGHMTSTVKKQQWIPMLRSLSHLFSPRLSPWMVQAALRLVLSISTNLIQITPHRHAQSLVHEDSESLHQVDSQEDHHTFRSFHDFPTLRQTGN